MADKLYRKSPVNGKAAADVSRHKLSAGVVVDCINTQSSSNLSRSETSL